ncbi:tetratricopeptide repeat protein [Jiulongibacter sp. NS-SX5]|uniref:tetratricopeptide repeat protein n=1 Tax=Jiulongibacter sp. NS-SX5 TaxID=3463854 RepID=UPI00405911A1
MKKLVLGLALVSASFLANGQSIEDLTKNAQCESLENTLKPLLKSSEHPKRGIKASTWVKLSEAYANYTTACGADSASAIKAWDAIHKAKELDTDGKMADKIDEVMHGQLMYSAIVNQGVAHYNSGNLEKATEYFHIGYAVDPSDTLTSLYAGISSNELGDTEMAKKAFIHYIEKANGDDASAFYTLSNMAKAEGNIDEAIGWLQKGIDKSDNKDLRGELVNIYIQNDMLDKAIADLEELSANDPSNTNVKLNLGLLYDNQGNTAKAEEIYHDILKIDPTHYDANFSLAVLHFNEAVKVKKEVDAMDMKTYQEKGAEIEAKACAKFQDSKPFFEKCLESQPDSAEVKENLNNLNNVLAQCK